MSVRPENNQRQPPPGYNQPPPAYSQPPPGYSQPPPGYSQPPPAYGRAPVQEQPAGVLLIYRAKQVAIYEISSCVLSLLFGIFNLTKFLIYPSFFPMSIVEIISLGLALVNIIFSSFTLATLWKSGCRATWAPIAFVTVIVCRIVVSIALIVLIIIVLIGANPKASKTTVALHRVVLIILLVMTVITILIYGWFISVMVPYIRYKKRLGSRAGFNEAEAEAAAVDNDSD